ncbi:hypothetical protein ACWEJ6_54065 [Nonomuraea sp. NPDC004702]
MNGDHLTQGITDSHQDIRDRMRRGWVVWSAYLLTARHLIRLVTPSVLVFVPLGLVASLGLVPVVGGSATLVNGSFELFHPPVGPLLAWTVVATGLVLAAQVVVLPATVVLAAGLLTGRRVRVSEAMRAAVRRLPAMLGLALLGLLVCAAIAAAGFGLRDGPLPGVFFMMAVLALIAMPCLLSVAAVTLEGQSPGKAIARGYRLACAVGPTQSGLGSSLFALALGVLVLPVAARQAVEWAASGHLVLGGAATSVLGLVLPAFQATVIARLYLRRLALRGTPAEFDRVVESLPDSGPSPARPVPVLAALLLPGLLYAGTMLVNPFGWLEVDQTVVTASWSHRERPPQDGRPAPTLGTWDLRAVFAGQGSNMVMLMDGSDQARTLTCADSACARYRYAWAEPAHADKDPISVGTRLPDGRIVLTTWTSRGEDKTWRAKLGLLVCDAKGCLPPAGGRSPGEVKDEDREVALAPGHYGGLMIAQARDNEKHGETISVTTCEDETCAQSQTKDLIDLPSRASPFKIQGLAVAAGPLNAPVVVRSDDRTGSVTVITCEDSCDTVRVEHPVQGGWTWGPNMDGDTPPGATVLVRKDGRPLIAYRDSADGSARLLDCRNRSCSQGDTVVLSTPGAYNMPPALAVDEAGRALVAYQDLSNGQIVVASCWGTRCTHTPVAKSTRAPGPGLAMALDARGQPVIAWIDGNWGDFDLVVTNPHNLPS